MVTNQTQTELREIKLIERVVSPTDLLIHARKVVIIQGKKTILLLNDFLNFPQKYMSHFEKTI